MKLDDLPVELLADIFSLTDLACLIILSQVSAQIRAVISDPVLNPWRAPLHRALRDGPDYPPEMRSLGARPIVPQQNFIEILSLATPDFLLLDATLPNLKQKDWAESFNRRFLPSWRKAKLGTVERRVFKETLWTIHHRLNTSCSTQQAWCNYLVVHKSGVVNTLSAYTRTYDPLILFESLKAQSDLAHLETEVRLIVQFRDVRVIALGVLHRPRSFMVNRIARMLLHPPGAEVDDSTFSESEPGSPSEDEINISSGINDLESRTFPTQEGPPTVQEVPLPQIPIVNNTPGAAGRTQSFFRTRSRESTGASPTRSIFRTLSRESDGPESGRSTTSGGLSFFRSLRRAGTEVQPDPSRLRSSTGIRNELIGSPMLIPAPAPHSPPLTPKSPRSPSKAPRKSGVSPYPTIQYPRPIPEFRNYPNFTPGGADERWKGSRDLEEDGRLWVGPMLITAQLTHESPNEVEFDGSLLGEGKFVSFVMEDLSAIAGWLNEKIGKSVGGWSLGID